MNLSKLNLTVSKLTISNMSNLFDKSVKTDLTNLKLTKKSNLTGQICQMIKFDKFEFVKCDQFMESVKTKGKKKTCETV